MRETTPDVNTVRFARRFVVRRPDHPDMHGIQFPPTEDRPGLVIADNPPTGFTGAVSVDALCEGMDGHTVHWADEEDNDRG